MSIRVTVFTVLATFYSLLSLLTCSANAQEKTAWTGSPSTIYQRQGAYPGSVTVRLFLNKCQYDNQGQPLANQLQGSFSLTVTGTGVSASQPQPADGCSLTTTLTIGSAAQPGLQAINVANNGHDVGFASFGFMDATAGPTPDKPEVDVLWEVLTDHVCKDNFGNHMPSDLYCIDVKIGNNSGHALQLAGLGFKRKSLQCKSSTEKSAHSCVEGGGDISTPNVSYQTVRGSAQTGTTGTLRNKLFNGTQALGLLMASFTPFFENASNKSRWSTGASIVSSGITQGINLVAPDLTLRELNNLDDQAFRDGKLIPNNTQIRLLVFVQKQSLAEAISETVPQIKNASFVKCSDGIPIGYKKINRSSTECYPEWEDGFKQCLKKLQCNPVIVKLALGRLIIIGDQIDYIQRVVVDPAVTSQETPVPSGIESATLSLAPAANAPTVTLAGTNLQNVDKLSIACKDAANPANSLSSTDISNFKTSPNQLTFNLPAGTLHSTAPCDLTVTTKSGQKIVFPNQMPK